MPHAPIPEVEPVRDASRRLVRALGFMREGLAGTDLPPSAVHALLEADARGTVTAGELADILALEKSSVSRMLGSLQRRGEIAAAPAPDGRTRPIMLTPRGRDTVAAIHDLARRQVAGALGSLKGRQRRTVAEGLGLYADALGAIAATPPSVTIEFGWRPGALARCGEMHACYYARAAGFGPAFEAKILSGLAEFSGRLDRPANGLWLAVRAGEILGTVAIDGEHLGDGAAHLRWFIVDDGCRGMGVGRRLLAEALRFCDQRGVRQTHLWTFPGLDAARHLYEAHGFSLADERPGRQWGGHEVLEQRFVRPIDPSAA